MLFEEAVLGAIIVDSEKKTTVARVIAWPNENSDVDVDSLTLAMLEAEDSYSDEVATLTTVSSVCTMVVYAVVRATPRPVALGECDTKG